MLLSLITGDTLITCFRWYLAGYSTLKLLLSTLYIAIILRRYINIWTLCKYPIYHQIFITDLASSLTHACENY